MILTRGATDEDRERRIRLMTILLEKDETVMRTAGARRALALLARIETSAAAQLLNELSQTSLNTELRKIAESAIAARAARR